MVKRPFFLIGVLVLLGVFTAVLFAGTTGKIAGVVTDEESGKPLPGANVQIVGTPLGAATDVNGRFVILNVSPGTYSIKAAMMGYDRLTVTDVRVDIDLTSTVNFTLTPALVEMKEMVVSGARPLVIKDLTATRHIVTSEEIANMPVDNFQSLALRQAGVVGYHFRGGRSDEVVVAIDGIRLRDPATSYVPGLGGFTGEIPETAVSEMEVTTGGFSAEYGNVLSGIVNVVTKEGGNKTSGKFQFKTSNFFPTSYRFKQSNWSEDGDTLKDPILWNDPLLRNQYEFSMSGPVPILPGGLKYFLSSDIVHRDRGWYPNNMYYNRSYQGKLTYRITPTNKLNLGGMLSDIEYDTYGYPAHQYEKNDLLDHVSDYHRKTNQAAAQWTSVLNPKTFFEVKLSRYNSHYICAVHDVDDTDGDGDTEEYLNWDVTGTPEKPDSGDYRYEKREPGDYGYRTYQIIGDDTIPSDENWYREVNSQVYTATFGFNSQVTNVHLLKTGVEFTYGSSEVRSISGLFYTNVYRDEWNQDPLDLALYIQDKIEYGGLIVNAGLRVDYFDPNGLGAKLYYPADLNNAFDPGIYPYPMVDSVAAKSLWKLSPRIGVSHPITEKSVLRFSYGHFFQRPDGRYLYQNLANFTQGKFYGAVADEVGNPNLKPQTTVSYELGIDHQILKDIKISITGYYKDITNLIGTHRYSIGLVKQFDAYTNIDYGNVRGAEFTITKRFSNYFGGSFNYTYSIAKGRSSSPFMLGSYLYEQWLLPQEMYFLDWDQRHTINTNLNVGIPNNFNINVLFRYGSGLPFSSPASPGMHKPPINDRRMPSTSTTDLRVTKELNLIGVTALIVFEGFNIFDRKNLDYIEDTQYYINTGNPTREHNPTVWSTGRTLRIGLGFKW
jgi:outer membrane receptor protein involved in Fe transport